MTTFREADQVRLSLKMKLSYYSWYSSSAVISDSNGYSVVIAVKRLNNNVRKIVPQIVNGISIKTELE